MNDLITYAPSVRQARAAAVVASLDAASTAGNLRLYATGKPAVLDAPSAGPISELVLAKPCGAVNEQGEIVFFAVADAMVSNAGVVTWARLSDGDGNAIADLDVGLPGSGAAIILADTDLKAGALIRVTMAKLIEP